MAFASISAAMFFTAAPAETLVRRGHPASEEAASARMPDLHARAYAAPFNRMSIIAALAATGAPIAQPAKVENASVPQKKWRVGGGALQSTQIGTTVERADFDVRPARAASTARAPAQAQRKSVGGPAWTHKRIYVTAEPVEIGARMVLPAWVELAIAPAVASCATDAAWTSSTTRTIAVVAATNVRPAHDATLEPANVTSVMRARAMACAPILSTTHDTAVVAGSCAQTSPIATTAFAPAMTQTQSHATTHAFWRHTARIIAAAVASLAPPHAREEFVHPPAPLKPGRPMRVR